MVTSLIEQDSIYDIGSTSDAEISQLLESEQQRWNIDCIVIDPGHGGKDPGALGYSGLKEKAVVLDIGRRLRDLLEEKTDLKVV
ncbi:N-acetylmuramoyl-L-alanine amidase, partial [bacterium]|nr:N-acetylmuramoyl-L-alanine amidase [bacterium]